MARSLLAGGALAASMGAAMMIPVAQAWSERPGLSAAGIGVLWAGSLLIGGGAAALVTGLRRPRDPALPSGARLALMVNALLLAFFALELSDRLVRQDGRLFYWSTFLLPPALTVFVGLLGGRRWAWVTTRGATGVGVLWFVGFVALLPFVPLYTDGVPVPWYGRVYMAGVSLLFAGAMAGAFRSLGRAETRTYFGIITDR